jgi:hypothetical protein
MASTVDWFQQLAGFKERDYTTTQARFEVLGSTLRSKENFKTYAIGEFSTPSLAELRAQLASLGGGQSSLKVSLQSGDIKGLHQESELKGALFQVASQFNMLEMIGPGVTPEDGVTRYRQDPTQGPACAIAAGAATIYRNYFVPVGGGIGQRANCQIDGLADVGACLSGMLGAEPSTLWTMRNGYALCTEQGLTAIGSLLARLTVQELDDLRSHLRIGIHRDVQVTYGNVDPSSRVSQAFCSALPVAYSQVPRPLWQAFATLVLEAAYEATLWAAVLNAHRGASNIVLLTRLGGGAFGNDEDWIHDAMARALDLARNHALDVRIVSYREPSPSLRTLAVRYP